MSESRPWYREPESFIALAALVVSLSAVIVGLYEAALQRKHDRAEVWPRMEIAAFIKPWGAVIYVQNTGIGPAIVKRITVSVDGRPARSWQEVLPKLFPNNASIRSNATVLNHALRAGDSLTLIAIDFAAPTKDFWQTVGRSSVAICYASVFDEYWTVSAKQLGGELEWTAVRGCDAQPKGVYF